MADQPHTRPREPFQSQSLPADEDWPLAREQLDAAKKAFVDAIDPDAVCSLASSKASCSFFREQKGGSFNVCFFVEFDDEHRTRWNVRVAIMPVLRDAWAKVQSEVATMRYVRQQTTIPVARVHAYGRHNLIRADADSTTVVATDCVYTILDFIPGHSIDMALTDDTQERRAHLYVQVIDVLVQLRGLEFDTGDSLYPGPDSEPDNSSESEPIIGNLLSILDNELYTMTSGRVSVPQGSIRSTAEYILYQYGCLIEAHELPSPENLEMIAQMEVYALHNIKTHILDMVASSTNNQEPFVLAHTDLRWYNIVVDDDLNVQGIIDWEWSGTVPRSLFMPPTWLAGCSPNVVTSTVYRKEYKRFYAVLTSMAGDAAMALASPAAQATTARNPYQELADQWGPDLPTRPFCFPLAMILQHHLQLINIYFFAIFPKLVQPYLLPRDYLPEFFALDEKRGGALSKAVCARFEKQKRYAQYLKSNGITTKSVLSDAAKEWLRNKAALNIKSLNNFRGLGTMGRSILDPSYDHMREHFAESVLLESMDTWDIS
ncbi:hypothetical protein SCUCBS95973_004178 [Sporothrix curviconia]|uniref:Aminoglycoside phosphotransferase domain-containing protein n=1 Tax=Sporothrix curviconia TaxID=1260050 RepID=A0ABP0BM12_9PEZI